MAENQAENPTVFLARSFENCHWQLLKGWSFCVCPLQLHSSHSPGYCWSRKGFTITCDVTAPFALPNGEQEYWLESCFYACFSWVSGSSVIPTRGGATPLLLWLLPGCYCAFYLYDAAEHWNLGFLCPSDTAVTVKEELDHLLHFVLSHSAKSGTLYPPVCGDQKMRLILRYENEYRSRVMERTIFTWDNVAWADLAWIPPREWHGQGTLCCKCTQAGWHARQIPDPFWQLVPSPAAFLHSWQNVLCQWEDGRHCLHAGFCKGWGRRGWQGSLSQVWFVKRVKWSSLNSSVSREMQLQEHGCCSWEIPLCQKDIVLIPRNVLWPLAWGQWIHWWMLGKVCTGVVWLLSFGDAPKREMMGICPAGGKKWVPIPIQGNPTKSASLNWAPLQCPPWRILPLSCPQGQIPYPSQTT